MEVHDANILNLAYFCLSDLNTHREFILNFFCNRIDDISAIIKALFKICLLMISLSLTEGLLKQRVDIKIKTSEP